MSSCQSSQAADGAEPVLMFPAELKTFLKEANCLLVISLRAGDLGKICQDDALAVGVCRVPKFAERQFEVVRGGFDIASFIGRVAYAVEGIRTPDDLARSTVMT